ncbi:MAG: terminase small subunit [Clostridia bacterium]|nr:terminase small subunit [Clostridia bacterium]
MKDLSPSERRDFLKKELTEKEKLFCAYYADGGDARGCAARAGYQVMPQRNAAKLLAREDIRSEISRLEKEKRAVGSVERGLMRLAFGSVADAMKLMLCEETMSADEIEKLDLFNVSDIKRPKGGGLEIKFFDRLKALERLEKIGNCEADMQSSFVKALSDGARLLSEEDES